MSFVTRCPDCGTAFRVVPDQLKISEGWVRCGHCQAVFDATLDLQLWPGETAVPNPVSPVAEAMVSEPMQAAPEPASSEFRSEADLAEIDPKPSDSAVSDAPGWHEPLAAPESSPEPEPEPEPDPPPQAGESSSREESDHTEAPAGRPVLPEPEPSFVRQARRRAFWRRPLVRVVLLTGSLGLAFSLALQWTVHHRDQIAATRPDWRPALERVCRALGCELKPWRDVQALQLEDTGLRRLAPGRYALELVLRNQGVAEVATPSLELSLTDNSDRVWLRKVFGPADLADLPPTIAAQGRLPVRLELAVEGGASADAAVSGYRVLFFYP